MTNENSEFWSKIGRKYDYVVDLQIGPQTRLKVRERPEKEDRLGALAEFGCGTGFYTTVLANKADSVVATDLAPGMLAVARQRIQATNVKFQEEDCQKTSLPDAAFDTAFMSLVIHFTEPAKTLLEMHRILKPRGTLIISNGDPGALNASNRLRWLVRGIYYGITRYRVKPPKGFAKNTLTEKQLCDLLVKSGFEIVCTETIRNTSRSSYMPVEYIKSVKIYGMKLAKRFGDLGYLLATGFLATITMDVIAIASVKSGIFKLGHHQIGPHLLGRWVGSFLTGRVIHSNIFDTSPLPHEVAIGVASHYAIGFTLSSVFVISWFRIFARKIDLSSALIFGISTCVFPYFLMFPAMGFGVMGLKTVHESMLLPFSAFNHAVFGVGIFIWTHLLSRYYLSESKMITSNAIRRSAPSSQIVNLDAQ